MPASMVGDVCYSIIEPGAALVPKARIACRRNGRGGIALLVACMAFMRAGEWRGSASGERRC